MHKALEVDNSGVTFHLFESEYEALDEIARTDHHNPLDLLTIGRAAFLCHAIPIIAARRYDGVVDDAGRVIASDELDGREATQAIITKKIKDQIGESITAVGRLTMEVIANADDGNFGAEPIFAVTILGSASQQVA